MFKSVFVELLQKNKVSAYELSKQTGIPDSLLSNYRTGKKVPTSENLQKIANYFNVSVDYLLGKTDKKNSPTNETVSELTKEVTLLFSQLPEDKQADALKYFQYLLDTSE